MPNFMRASITMTAFAGLLALTACADGMMGNSKVALNATLNGAQEVPPVPTAATGAMTGSLDRGTKTLTWTVSYSGLSGPVAAAHFHGPAAAGVNAGVVQPITVSASPMQGSAQLTDAQIADLLAGRWYVNIHTAARPGGEIRGQVNQAK